MSQDKLIYISSYDISKVSGPSINEMEYVSMALQQFGENAIFFLPKPSGSFEDIFLDHRVRFCNFSSKFRLWNWVKQQLWFFISLIKLNTTTNDLVYMRIPKQLPFGIFLVSFFIRAKIVLRHFSVRGVDSSKSKLQNVIYSKLNKLVIKHVAKKASLIESCTVEHKNATMHVLNIFHDKFYISTNGVNLSRILTKSNISDNGTITIGYVGGSPEIRGGVYVLKIVKSMRQKGISARGIIIGANTEEAERLADAAKKMGLQKYVNIQPIIPYEEVYKYLSRLDVGVAMNDPEVLKKVGNANQKLRQYLATGLFIVSDPSQKWLEEEEVGLTVSPEEREVDFIRLSDDIYNALKNTSGIVEKARVVAQKEFCLYKINQERVRIWKNRLGWQGSTIE